MSAEKNKCNEMTPAEDGTKVPLTIEKPDEAKVEANSNGDAKIDIGTEPTFSGLTKEELANYADDPFWVKLRWGLFILFWLGWGVMLVMAIVIIVRAPGCEPPPVRLWVEEGAIYAVDTSNLPSEPDLSAQLDRLGVNSVYMPSLINANDFSMSNYNADALIKALVDDNKYVVTDLPNQIRQGNVLYPNASLAGLIDAYGQFNYTNANLTTFIADNLLNIWINRGVKGFLMDKIATDQQEEFRSGLNDIIMEKDGAVGGNIIDMRDEESRIMNPDGFRDFLMQHKSDWNYYKFKPNYEAAQLPEYQVRLMNIAMFTFKGTPILLDFAHRDMTSVTARFINDLSDFRHHDSIKFGEVYFANNSADVISFTRVQKGTPAYAVALNFGYEEQIVQFNGTENVGTEGNVALYSTVESPSGNEAMREKVDLGAVKLNPFEGLIIQFVANFG